MSTDNQGTAGRIEERHLVLIDIENIAGNPCPTDGDLLEAHGKLQQVIPDLDCAQRVVAYNHRAAQKIAFWFPGALHRWRSGPDGADLALINEMCDLRVMGRFGRVTLCSGDGIFTDPVGALAATGIRTTVISSEDRLSCRLRMAAHDVVLIPGPDLTPFIEAAAGGGRVSRGHGTQDLGAEAVGSCMQVSLFSVDNPDTVCQVIG